MSKAELVWVRMYEGQPMIVRQDGNGVRCLLHSDTACYLIPAAGVPSKEELIDMYVQWRMNKVASGEKDLGYNNFARHVLDLMGLKEVKS